MAQSAGWEWVESNNLEAYVVRPDNGNLHAIVLLQEILGVNATMRECAATMGEEGYAVAVPDLYWRLHRRVDLGYDKDQVESGFSFSKRLDDRLACDDIAATVRHVRATMPQVRFVHLMGFCLGGRLAVLAALDRERYVRHFALWRRNREAPRCAGESMPVPCNSISPERTAGCRPRR